MGEKWNLRVTGLTYMNAIMTKGGLSWQQKTTVIFTLLCSVTWLKPRTKNWLWLRQVGGATDIQERGDLFSQYPNNDPPTETSTTETYFFDLWAMGVMHVILNTRNNFYSTFPLTGTWNSKRNHDWNGCQFGAEGDQRNNYVPAWYMMGIHISKPN